MPLDDSTSHLDSSILLLPKYLLTNILYTLKKCQCFSIFISIIVVSTVFAAQISTFNNRGISNSILAFPVRSTDTALNDKYLTCTKHILTLTAFIIASFKTSIKFASACLSKGSKNLFPYRYLKLRVRFIKCSSFVLRFLYLT